MADVSKVADYFLSKVNREEGDLITQLRLYKLVYYAQVWSLVLTGYPLFRGEIQAWRHGPVPVALVSSFKHYGKEPIPAPETGSDFNTIDQQEMGILDAVWDAYGRLSASELWKLSHAENPWRIARADLGDDEQSQETILEEEIKRYYSHFVSSSKEFKIPPEALRVDKQIYVTLERIDGEKVKVPIDQLEEYIWANMESLKTETCS
ncbi:hypothetical protein C7293_16495 [filamentous cyanobacterium CCT1]|nr:hypothetical protein C7293_16495 [filamentous cyanobacterium CCT1]PSN81330.1 hypothetical protein C8B47_01905 [filamentous cyanobacterium CCP4]